MKRISKAFVGGIVLGLPIGVLAGMFLFFESAGYVQYVLLRRAAAKAAARTGTIQQLVLPDPHLTPPDRAIAFDFGLPLSTPDGHAFDLQALRAKTVLVNVWATWCQPCLAELPTLDAVAARFRDDHRVAFLLISRDVPRNLRSYLDHHKHPSIPIAVLPPGTEIPGAGTIVPETFIVAPSGEVKALHRGAANWNDPSVVGFLADVAEGSAPNG